MTRLATRRRFLEATTVGALASLAGCADVVDSVGESTGTETESVSASGDSQSEDTGTVQEVGEAVRPAVVKVETETSSGRGGGGTGWFVDDGVVVTNSHVVDGARSVTCWTLDGASFEPAVVGSTDYQSSPYNDVAVLQADVSAPETLSIGDESALTEGQTVVQVGHPFAIGNWVISTGEYVRDERHGDGFLTTTPHMSGNSGSPLVTMDGAVVGLTTGGVPKARSVREAGEAPEPVAPTVYESYQDATYATHNSASVVQRYLDEWTS